MVGAISEKTVVFVTPDRAIPEDLNSELHSDITVRSVRYIESLQAGIHQSDLCCVILSTAFPDQRLEELTSALLELDANIPVILLHSRELSGALQSLASERPIRVLPREPEVTTLSAVVKEAVERYEHSVVQSTKSEILQSLLDHIPQSLYAKDEQARYLFTSDSMPDSDSIIGLTDIEWLGADAKEGYEDDLRVIDSGDPILKKVTSTESSVGNDRRWTETTKVPWTNDTEDIQGLARMTRDVTRREELKQEVERKQALLKRIARYLAHDIRNPLNVAHGHLELAQENPSPEHFTNIEASLDRIEALVQNMEVMSGSDVSAVRVDKQPIPLMDVVTDAWDGIERANATLDIEFSETARIHADRSPLQEIFENLLGNAVEHGGSEVTITVGTLTDGFYVVDDGPGLPTDAASLLEYGVSPGDTGSGIGLAIVDEIARAYGWSISGTESESGGARFEVSDAYVITQSPVDAEFPFVEHTLDANTDIGDATPPGGVQTEDETSVVCVRGGGEDVYYQTNEHHFAYTKVAGDVRITTRVTSLEGIEEFSKAGLMIREGLQEPDPFGYIGITKGEGAEILWRESSDGPTVNHPYDVAATVLQWFRLERTDDVITTQISQAAESWIPVDQRRVPMNDPVHVGLAVCSHDPDELAEADFKSVTVETRTAPDETADPQQ